MPMAEAIRSHYRILVSRANLRPEAELYPFNVRESIPQFLFPLQSGDEEPVVNLSEGFETSLPGGGSRFGDRLFSAAFTSVE
jgi:hypothetical protein